MTDGVSQRVCIYCGTRVGEESIELTENDVHSSETRYFCSMEHLRTWDELPDDAEDTTA